MYIFIYIYEFNIIKNNIIYDIQKYIYLLKIFRVLFIIRISRNIKQKNLKPQKYILLQKYKKQLKNPQKSSMYSEAVLQRCSPERCSANMKQAHRRTTMQKCHLHKTALKSHPRMDTPSKICS